MTNNNLRIAVLHAACGVGEGSIPAEQPLPAQFDLRGADLLPGSSGDGEGCDGWDGCASLPTQITTRRTEPGDQGLWPPGPPSPATQTRAGDE